MSKNKWAHKSDEELIDEIIEENGKTLPPGLKLDLVKDLFITFYKHPKNTNEHELQVLNKAIDMARQIQEVCE
jgi:hypothetical protein